MDRGEGVEAGQGEKVGERIDEIDLERVRTGAEVVDTAYRPSRARRWEVALKGGERLEADALVVATPASTTTSTSDRRRMSAARRADPGQSGTQGMA